MPRRTRPTVVSASRSGVAPFHGMPAASSTSGTNRRVRLRDARDDGDAMQRESVLGVLHDPPCDRAHLVLRVGGRQHTRPDGRFGEDEAEQVGRRFRGLGGAERGRQPGGEPVGDRVVDPGIAGEPEHHRHAVGGGERLDERLVGGREDGRQVHDDVADVGEALGRRGDRARGREGEVGLVVVPAGSLAEVVVERDDRRGARTAGRERAP